MDGAQSAVGEANLVGWARPKSPTSKCFIWPPTSDLPCNHLHAVCSGSLIFS